MTCSVDTSQPLSLAIPVNPQWAHDESCHSGRDGGYARAQRHRLPLTKVNMATATVAAVYPLFQQQRTTLSP